MDIKICNMCNVGKPIEEFPIRQATGRPSGGKCKICYANHVLQKRGKERQYPYRAELTELEKNEIVTAFANKVSMTELGQKHSINRETIRKVLRERCVPYLSVEDKLQRQENQNIKQLKRLEEETGKTLEERQLDRRKRDRKRVVDAMAQALQGKSCVDCGNANILVLQFDHRNPMEKIRDVSKCKTVTALLAEIAKCDVVCANCHSVRTQKMFGSWRLDFLEK